MTLTTTASPVPVPVPLPLPLHLPRILCLHGGGVNAKVFAMQCRRIIACLEPYFRLVFVDAPFLSAPHPAIVTVYGSLGPFRRWLRWHPDHPEIDAEAAAAEIAYMCDTAMEDDPGTGEWVGILGFSQGAKIAASMLWTQERIADRPGRAEAATRFRFGVLMAGQAPLVNLDSRIPTPEYILDAAHLSPGLHHFPKTNEGDHVLGIPTLHVHGLQDPGLEAHRVLLDKYCKEGTASLVEWDGDHRLPIKTRDVDVLVDEILELARKTGVITVGR